MRKHPESVYFAQHTTKFIARDHALWIALVTDSLIGRGISVNSFESLIFNLTSVSREPPPALLALRFFLYTLGHFTHLVIDRLKFTDTAPTYCR